MMNRRKAIKGSFSFYLCRVISVLYQENTRGSTSDDFSGHFFVFFEIFIFCFVVALCNLVIAVEAMYDLPLVLTTSGNLF